MKIVQHLNKDTCYWISSEYKVSCRMKIKTNTTAKHIAVKLHTLVVEETILKYPTELSKTLQIHEYQSYVSIFISKN